MLNDLLIKERYLSAETPGHAGLCHGKFVNKQSTKAKLTAVESFEYFHGRDFLF